MNLKGYVSVAIPVPVSVQNLVLRDYCKRNAHTLSLSDVEFLTDYKMLEALLDNMGAWDGIVAYSMWIMPDSIVDVPVGKELHFALENLIWPNDEERIYSLYRIRRAMA